MLIVGGGGPGMREVVVCPGQCRGMCGGVWGVCAVVCVPVVCVDDCV